MKASGGEKTEAMIAMITDFGYRDFYAGILEAVIARAAPSVRVVDVTHGIANHAILEAGFVLDRVFTYFPEGTVFLAVVDPGVGGSRRNLVFETAGRFIVTPDNGLISDLAARVEIERCGEILERAIAPYRRHETAGDTFLGRDIFAPAAAAVALEGGSARLTAKVDNYVTLPLPACEVAAELVRGAGRYIDHFGNIITNIGLDSLAKAFPGVPLDELNVYIEGRRIGGVGSHYAGVNAGEFVALLDSWGRIEVSICQGSAAEVLGCTRAADVAVELRADR